MLTDAAADDSLLMFDPSVVLSWFAVLSAWLVRVYPSNGLNGDSYVHETSTRFAAYLIFGNIKLHSRNLVKTDLIERTHGFFPFRKRRFLSVAVAIKNLA